MTDYMHKPRKVVCEHEYTDADIEAGEIVCIKCGYLPTNEEIKEIVALHKEIMGLQ